MVAQISDGKIALGGLFDSFKVQVNEYAEIINKFNNLDLSQRKYLGADGKANWEAIAKAIGTTDARAIGYFKTLDNGKGTIDNSSASVEGMSVYLKKTGQAFDFAALKASLLNAALNAGIMIAFAVAIKAVEYAWDQANTTVAEVQERIDDLTDSISSLETEYNNLKDAGSENLTDAEQARLQYLEDRIEREKELKELEEARLIREKYGNGFTDYFDEDNYNQKYSEFKEEYFGGYHNNDVAALDVGIKTEKQNVIDMGSSIDEYLESQEKLKQYIEQMNNHNPGDNSYEMAKSLYDKEIKKSEDLLSKVQEEYQNYKTVQYEAQNEIDSMKADLENPNLTKTDKDNIQAMIDRYQQMIDIANYFVGQMRDIPGVPLDTDTDTYYNWFNKLSDDEKDLTHSDEFKQALEEQKEGLNGAALSAENYDAALQSIQSTQDDTTESIAKTKSEMIDTINDMSDGFDVLDKIYADVKDGDVFDFTNLDSKKFTEAFSGLEDEYTAFIEKVSSSPNDIKGCQEAFNELVSAWINSKGILKDLTEENANVAESMLKNMGISNAEEIIQGYLDVIKEVTNAGYDLENITEDEAVAFLNQANASDTAKQYLINYLIQKQLAQQPLNTSADILALENLCDKLGVTGEMYKYVTGLKSAFAAVDAGAPLAAYQSQIDSYKEKISDLASAGTVNFKFNYSGGDSSNKTSKSGSSSKSSSKDELKEAFQAEYDLLKHNLEMEYITEEQYYNGVQALNEKYFAGKEEYLDDYRKYEEEVYKGLKSYYKSYCDDMMDYYDKKLDASKMSYKEYCDSVSKMLADMHNSGKISDKDWYDYTKTMLEKQKDAYDRALSAITRRLQKEIDAWQAKIDALNDQNDALNDQKDQMDSAIDAITKVYDTEIDRIQGIIDGLKEANDERERTLALEQAKYELEKAYSQRVKKIYTEGKGYIYEVDYDAIKDAKKSYDNAELDVKTDELQKQIDTLEEFKKKWQDVQNAYQENIDNMNATALLGSEYQKLVLNNNILDIENFKTKYLKIQSQINDNEQLIKSYEEKVEYYTKLKEQWQSLTDEYSNSVDDMYAKMLLGQSWESDVLNGRLSTLNDFRNQYNDIQKSISDMAWQSANAQISALNAVKAAEATKAQTSGGSNGYSGSSGNVSSVGGNTSGGSGLTAAQKYQVRLAGTVKVIYEGSSETDLRNWITKNNYIGVSRTIQNNIIIYFAKKKEKKYIGQVYKTSGQASSQVGMLGGVGYDKVSGGYQVYKYAKGTNNAKKGWHIVSEENPELIARNNGEIDLAKGEQFYKFEGGETVIPADETKEILKNQGNVEQLSDSDVITRKDGSILKPIHYEYENILTNFIKDNPDYMYSMNNISDNLCKDLFKNTENVNYDNRNVDTRVSIGEIHLHKVQDVDQFARELDRQLAGIVDQKLSRRKR